MTKSLKKYHDQNAKLKVTQELECDTNSGEIILEMDVSGIKKDQDSQSNESLVIKAFINAGYKMKKQQIVQLNGLDFDSLAKNFKN